jgi:hypothetical protein
MTDLSLLCRLLQSERFPVDWVALAERNDDKAIDT